MAGSNSYNVIIIGGSYSGLAAAMALGRAMMRVMIIDDGKPCNRQTPHSHNFLTNDGKTPAAIAASAKLEVRQYESISFYNDTALYGRKNGNFFEIETATGQTFVGSTLIFATGIKDLLPEISGLSECWGISVLHCPYCHGYEVRNKRTGIIGNGEAAFDFTKLISNWTQDLTLFSNGQAGLTGEQREALSQRNIAVVEHKIERLDHDSGYVRHIVFKDGSRANVAVLYAPVLFEQACKIPIAMGCNLTEEGYINIDSFNETSISGVYAIGDNASKMRTVANAVATGTSAGMIISKKMILDQ